ncbi:MAG TPA: hypothetical protein VEU30_16615, partial [Thermoanaerobaculia bacterium]|nr:hypothetical protein [Thermoanaerobaculia bacterium]
MDYEPHSEPGPDKADRVDTVATTSSESTPREFSHEMTARPVLSPFYLSPFVLAAVTWWVATRKHPAEKEKWSMLALGFTFGAVLMFGLVFFSERTGKSDFDADAVPASVLKPAVRLAEDHGVEVLPLTRIRQGRSVAAGSLQITLVGATS